MRGRVLRFSQWLGASLALLIAVVTLSGLLVRLAPGDAARAVLGPMADEVRVAELRESLGLERPLVRQILADLAALTRGDLGRSLRSGQPVVRELGRAFGFTFLIGAAASAIALFASYGYARVAFRWPRSAALGYIMRSSVSAPAFLWAILGAVALGAIVPALPLSGAGWTAKGLLSLVGPVLVASVYPTAVMSGVLADRVIAVLHSPYYRTARGLGIAGRDLFSTIVLPNARSVWATAWINQLGALIFSTMVLEILFSVPGGGSLLLRSLQANDYPVVRGILLANAAFFILALSLGRRLAREGVGHNG